MRRDVTLAGTAVAAILCGCGGAEPDSSPKPLPRVEVRASQGTDIGALPTVAPPPDLSLRKKPTGGGGAPSTPTPTPTQTPTATFSPAPTPTVIHQTPTPVPTPTFAPPDG